MYDEVDFKCLWDINSGLYETTKTEIVWFKLHLLLK